MVVVSSWAISSAGTNPKSTPTAVNSGALALRFCSATTNASGFARRAASTSHRLVVSFAVAATNATASATWPLSTTCALSPSPASTLPPATWTTVTSNPSARRSELSSSPYRPWPQTTHRPCGSGSNRRGSGVPGALVSQIISW